MHLKEDPQAASWAWWWEATGGGQSLASGSGVNPCPVLGWAAGLGGGGLGTVQGWDFSHISSALLRHLLGKHQTAVRTSWDGRESSPFQNAPQPGKCGDPRGSPFPILSTVLGDWGHPHSSSPKRKVLSSSSRSRGGDWPRMTQSAPAGAELGYLRLLLELSHEV